MVRRTALRTSDGVPDVNQTACGVVISRATRAASRSWCWRSSDATCATEPGTGGGTYSRVVEGAWWAGRADVADAGRAGRARAAVVAARATPVRHRDRDISLLRRRSGASLGP